MKMVKMPKELHPKMKNRTLRDKTEGIKDGIYVRQLKCPHCGTFNIIPGQFLLDKNNRNRDIATCIHCNAPLIEDPIKRSQAQVDHFILHLPAYLFPEQLQFIQQVAEDVKRNKPMTTILYPTLQWFLKKVIEFRNYIIENEEQEKWSEEDDLKLEKYMKEFKPMLDFIIENYKLKIKEFRRD